MQRGVLGAVGMVEVVIGELVPALVVGNRLGRAETHHLVAAQEHDELLARR